MAGPAQSELFQYLLRRGDDALILAQRHAEWSSKAPTLEVDLSLSNIGLDLLGQAKSFLDYAGEVEGKGRDGDTLAFRRDAHDFTNCLLVEQPNGDFGQTMARQFLFSAWQKLLFAQLTGSNDEHVAAISAKAIKEVSYHESLSAEWLVRLGDGTEESHARMQQGLGYMWRFVDELFQIDSAEAVLAEAKTIPDPGTLREAWDHRVNGVLAEATLERPAETRAIAGGRQGRHTEHLGPMLAEMQFLPRAYPDAKW